MTRGLHLTLAAVLVAVLGVGSVFAFTPSVAPIPDVIIGDLTPVDGQTPGDVTTQGASTIESANDVFEFVDAFNLFNLVGDTPNTPSVSGFTSDEAMIYSFVATAALGAPTASNPARISINGTRIAASPTVVDLSVAASAELDFKDESFSADSDADAISVMNPNFVYPFQNDVYNGDVTAALIDANVITLTVQNQQANTDTADFMVWTVNQGPDSLSGGVALGPQVPSDLSSWTYIAAASTAGVFGPTFTGDASATGTKVADADSDGSGQDLVINLGDTTGDSYVYFVSPLSMIPFVDGGTYRVTWVVSESAPSAASTTFRLRYLYGAFGILGNGVEQVTPGVALASASGTAYEYVFDMLDAAAETAADADVTLFFDSVDLIPGVGGSTTTLRSVDIQQLDRAALIASGTPEGGVDTAWNTSVVGQTGAYNTTTSAGVTVNNSNANYATVTSPGPTGTTLTAGQYGASPNLLAFNGIGLTPFAPSATNLAFFRAEFDLDFSGATVSAPISQTSLTMAFFKDFGGGAIGQTLSNETNINITNPVTNALNSTLTAPSYAAYLAVPGGYSLDPAGTVGGLVGANVRQIDSTNAGGVLTINSIQISSFPEGLLP